MGDRFVCVDLETKDPNLTTKGCGALRGDGHVLGVGLYDGNTSEYLPPDHPKIRDVMGDRTITKIFHNGVYDLDWIVNSLHLDVNGRIEDTMTRESLLDTYSTSYHLDDLCKKWGVGGKNRGDTIDRWWEEHGGKGKAIRNLDLIPNDVVGKYCKQDCIATWDLFWRQKGELDGQNLNEANDTECKLYPVLMEMKRNGLRVDLHKRDLLEDRVNGEKVELEERLYREYGLTSCRAPTQLTPVFNKLGIETGVTATGKMAFDHKSLVRANHPLCDMLIRLRLLDDTINKYLHGAILDSVIGDRIHPTFYPAKRDKKGGTVTGRFSCANPNMQNFSSRENKFGNEMRGLFIPNDGCLLGAFDYKQIEYVTFIHFAVGEGADEARQHIIDGMDYHTVAMMLLGWDVNKKDNRHLIKTLNFGSIYGLTVNGMIRDFDTIFKKPADDMGVPVDEYIRRIHGEYMRNLKFIKPTMMLMEETCKRRGWLWTLGRRKIRPPVPVKGYNGKVDVPWYKVVNYLVQGSASDILKKGLVMGWEHGVFDTLKLHGTVHDENVFSIPDSKEGMEAAVHFAECMSQCVQLSVPVRVDREIGWDWGNCKGSIWDKKLKQFGLDNF